MLEAPRSIGKGIDRKASGCLRAILGHDRIQLVCQGLGGGCKVCVFGACYGGKTQMERFEFCHGKVQWGQGDRRSDAVTDAAFALNRDTRGSQRVHIAIDRAQGHIGGAGQIFGPVQITVPQQLDKLHQSVGTAHGLVPLGFEGSIAIFLAADK